MKIVFSSVVFPQLSKSFFAFFSKFQLAEMKRLQSRYLKFLKFMISFLQNCCRDNFVKVTMIQIFTEVKVDSSYLRYSESRNGFYPR